MGQDRNNLRQTGGLPLAVIAIVGTAILIALAPPESRDLVAYGCVCIVIVVAMMLRVAKVVGALSAAPVLGFLPWLAVTWPATVIYFAVASPDATYLTSLGPVPFLLRAEVLLFAVLLFLGGYGAGIAPVLLGHQRQTPALPRADEIDVEWWLIVVAAIAITMDCAVAVANIHGTVRFIANGLHSYLTGMVFLAGYRWRTLSRSQRLLVVLTLSSSGIVYTVANSRGTAVLPLAVVVFGYVVSPGTTRRARVILLTSVLVALPIYTVVGNQTRIKLGSIGFRDFDQRAEVLADALSGNIIYQDGGFLEDTMGRLYSVGGHALLVANWDRMKIQEFDLAQFGIEFAEAMLPTYLVGSKDFDSYRYVGHQVLRNYGFLITEETSVEVTLIGSLCAAGGPLLVALGGLVLGLFHLLLIRVTDQFRLRAWTVPFAGCLFATGMFVHTIDIIQLVRTYLWAILYTGIVIQVCMFLAHKVFSVRPTKGLTVVSISPAARDLR